ANVTGMSYMFEGCSGIKNLNIANWNVSKVTNANGIFSGCSSLTQIIASTNTDWSGINNGDNMFTGCTKLKGGAGTEYAAANVGKAYAVTDGYNSKNGYFSATSAGQGAYAVFDGVNKLTFKYSDKEVREFGTVYPVENTPSDDPNNIPWKDHKAAITEVEFTPAFSVARPKSTANWFNGMVNLEPISTMANLNTSEVTNMSGMFVNVKKPASANLSKFNTAKVTDMSRMFEGCSGFTELDMSKFDTSQVTDMRQMFSGCSSLQSLDVTKFNTSNVTNMSAMFNGCSSLTTLDVSKFNTSKVTNMTNMFKNCSKLETIEAGEVKDWKTSAVSQSDGMFTGCEKLKGVYEYNAEHTDVNMANTTKGYFKPIPPQKPTVTGIDGEMTGVYGEGTTITVNATAPEGHSLEYQWYSNTTESNEGGTKIKDATNASYQVAGTVPVGTYYYYCEVTAKRDDNGLTDTATSGAATVTITKATPNVTAPDDITATYGETLENVTLPDNWAWVDEATTSVGTAGEHTFSATYTPTDTANYNPVTMDVTVTVGKATPTVSAPTGITAKYGQTLEDIELPDGWSWKDSTESVGNVGNNEFTAVYTPDDTDNYNTAEIDVTVTVGKADQVAPASPTAGEKTYSTITLEPITGGVNGVEYAITTTEEEPGEDDWTDNAEFTGLSTDTTYYIYARYKGDDSHNVSPSSHSAIKTGEHVHNWVYTANGTTITAMCKNTDRACPNTAGGTITIAAPENTDYDNNPHGAVVTNNLTTGADVQVKYEYKSWGADKYAIIDDLPVNSGMYIASITIGEATISVSYSINVNQQSTQPDPIDDPGTEKLYTVAGGTVGSGIPVVPVTGVKLRIDSLDKEVVSGAYGLFQFTDLPAGKYILTITYTDSNNVERTKDQVFEVTGNDINRIIVVPDKNVSSSVDIDESLDNVYVDSLDEVAADLAKDEADDADVKIKLTVEPEDEDDTNEAQNEIRKLAGEESDHMDFIDIKVTKTVGDGEAEVIDQADKSVRILIPYDSEKQYSVKVYHYDTNASGETKAVSLGTNKKASEYYEITDDGYIAIVTNKFTTYAIAYDDEPAPTPTPIVIRRGGGGGGGGGSSTKATPTPVPTESPEPTETPEPAPTETPEPSSGSSGDDGWWFIDVPKIEWFYPPIYYAYYNDLMYGTSEDTFEPYLDITRAMFVTVLYRIDGSPEVPLDYTFEDIDEGSYYEAAVAWGSANDIIAGYSAEEYAPYQTITREQMAAILWRYAKYKGTDVSIGEDTSIDHFIDADETSEYAIPALKWAYGDKILSGFEDATLRPQAFATRAQASVVLGEYNKKIKE
ncbi:MAG: BspA family leucine-rich repeat surface protein, partial [Clostridia bacterium]|nr:BspA family leucine-rich repeat surface protein [Clostridia bacterium]